MRTRLLAGALLACAALGAGLLALHPSRHAVPPGAADPAFAFYTSARGDGYAAIERWAHYGMRAERFVAAVEGAGYACTWQPDAAGRAGAGPVPTVDCRKTEHWPVARTLAIRAGFEHTSVDRLAWATVASTLEADGPAFAASLSAMLRAVGWMEPEALRVKGFQVDSIDTLARMVADSLANPAWHDACTELPLAAQCGQAAQERAASGFPALPEGPLPVGAALDVPRAMERLGFVPAVARGADGEPEDSLPVRVADGRMWMDFSGRDLAGNRLSASIEVASEGGAPARLVARLNGTSKSITLNGSPRRANDGSLVYLLPKKQERGKRYATWLNLPNPQYPGTLDRLAQDLPAVETAFIAPMAKTLIGHTAADSGPEDSLGLYPALRQMEQQAGQIRVLQPERWMQAEQGFLLMQQAFGDKPVTRAAWMLASCAQPGDTGQLDRDCVRRFAIADPAAAQLVRREVAHQLMHYLPLPVNHPVRMRLMYLSDTFSSGPT